MTWRAALGLAAGAATAALAALVLGEYELSGLVPLVAGLLVGLGVAEVVVGIGRARTPLVAGLTAGLAFGALAWAGWIDSTEGVEPIKAMVWVAAGLAAIVAFARVGGRVRAAR